jgi:hypothetical protein
MDGISVTQADTRTAYSPHGSFILICTELKMKLKLTIPREEKTGATCCCRCTNKMMIYIQEIEWELEFCDSASESAAGQQLDKTGSATRSKSTGTKLLRKSERAVAILFRCCHHLRGRLLSQWPSMKDQCCCYPLYWNFGPPCHDSVIQHSF